VPHVFIDQDSYYDWVLTPKDRVPPKAVVTDSQFEGMVLVRTLYNEPTRTESHIPDEFLAQNAADRAAAGLEPDPLGVLVRHFADAVMPAHCPPGSVRKVTSPDFPELGKALDAVFATKAAT
jgi:hypothetical protein